MQTATDNEFPIREDKRWKMVERTIKLYGSEPGALIETLHTVQESFGYIDNEALRCVASDLRLPPSLVYGVATFYHYFTLKPNGEHVCVVCNGTACYIGGSSALLDSIEKDHGIKPGETTSDGKLSLLTARCFGSCGMAPAGTFDGEVVGKLTPLTIRERLGRWSKNDA